MLTDKQKAALTEWMVWYSWKLDLDEGHSGYEQDLFEAFGCNLAPFPDEEGFKPDPV